MEFPNCIFSIYNDEYQEIFNNIKDSIRSIKEQNNLQKLSNRINDVVLDRLVELYQKFNSVSNQNPLYKVQEKCMNGFEITTTLFELDDSNNVIGQPYLSYWQGKSGI